MADCNTCKEKKKSLEPVPYIVHESAMARQERTIKRLWIALIVCSVLLAACVGVCYILHKNCLDKIESINNKWIDYISQYDFEDYTVDVSTDGGGDANYIGENGDIYNGTSDGSQTDSETEGR